MKKVLILIGRYLPGHKDGGPIRTIKNLTDALGDEYEFYVLCRDRDNGDNKPYPGIERGKWYSVGKTQVKYLTPNGFSRKVIVENAVGMDAVFSCGFMNDYSFNALCLHRGKLKDIPLGVACMGGLSEGAIRQKYIKKKAYILVLKMFGLFKGITWAVSAPEEQADVYKHIGRKAQTVICENIPRKDVIGKASPRKLNEPLKIVFLSRIAIKKNLIGAIRILSRISPEAGSAHFSICGPIEDPNYWEKCKAELTRLPSNITWEYCGDIETEKVPEKFSGQDVFLFPTLGENYGHVIFEAVSAGCIAVISDKTPWKLDGIGYVHELEDETSFKNTVEELINMPEDMFNEMSDRAVNMACVRVENILKDTGYRKILG